LAVEWRWIRNLGHGLAGCSERRKVVSGVKKRGLGRGLEELIEKREEEKGTRMVPVANLKPNPLQPRGRFDEAELAGLADSIRAQGLVQPLVVATEEDGTYSIIAGERRWRAAQQAGLAAVPVIVRRQVDDRERLELALVENLQRADLNPIEEAEAYQLLQQRFGLSQEEVATRVGKSRVAVTNLLRLLKLPPPVLEMLRAGELTAGQARPLIALAAAEEQLRLAQRAVNHGLSARELERLVAPPSGKAPKGPRIVEVHTAAAEEKLTRRLQTRVEIHRKGKGGRLQIHFHSEEELMRLYDLLMDREE
jgi:ParB family chromosome partitioning protein